MNLYEEKNRMRKAHDLAEALRKSNPSLPMDRLHTAASYMNLYAWNEVAKTFGIRPVSQETVDITLSVLKVWVGNMNIDPFDKLS